MESIYPLLTLPKPLDAANGRIQIKAVTTFNASRKRKRPEIAAAVDGDSLNIYKIQPSSLVLTHAVSPQVRFTSPPCSVYTKRKSTQQESRRTYVTTVDGTHDNATISCYIDTRTGLEPPVSRKVDHAIDSSSEVLALDVIQTSISVSSKVGRICIIVAYADGTLSCYSEELDQLFWSTQMLSSSLGSLIVADLTLTNAQDFKTGFLAEREDVLAQLLPTGSNNAASLEATPIILLTAQDSANNLRVVASVVRPQHAAQAGFYRPLEQLLEFDLSLESSESRLDRPRISWSIPTGKLYLSDKTTVRCYDFKSYRPRRCPSIGNPDQDIVSHLATNGHVVLAQQGDHLTMYDTTYGSIQDRKSIASAVTGTSKKRKRQTDGPAIVSLVFKDHFPKLGLTIAMQRHAVIAIQFTKAANKQICKPRESRLIDSLQKGVFSVQSQLDASHNSDSDWPSTTLELEKYVDEDEPARFDRVFAAAVGATSIVSETDDSEKWQWDSSRSYHHKNEHRAQALFALGCIFTVSGQERDVPMSKAGLSIQFFPPNTFQWLAKSGQLSKALIRQAFLASSRTPDSLQELDFVAAIVELDASLQVLCNVIRESPHLAIEDLVQCIKHIITSFDDALPQPRAPIASKDALLAITNGTSADAQHGSSIIDNVPNGFESQQVTNGTTDAELEHDMDAEVDDAIQDVDMALDDLQDDRSWRGEALSKCLTRLNAHSSISVTRALRQGLEHHAMIFLVHMLRVELAEGGWLSRYSEQEDEEQTVYHHSVAVVLNLINCALDAIGVAGFLAASASDPSESVDELLAALQAEHAAGMEGLNEAQFVNGALTTFLRFARRQQGAQTRSGDKAIRILRPAGNELPLGLKVEELSRSRRGAGGQAVQRSKRDIGMQISMKVPLYSMERIRV